jgi:putative ABC transport system substrate-binding protein
MGRGMRRRTFLGALGAAATWPVVARAQQASLIPKVGVLMGVVENDETRRWVSALTQALREFGWLEGRTVLTEVRWASADTSKMRALASELISEKCSVIVTHATPATLAFRSVMTTTPNVFVGAADPVGSGFVDSISRPGRNSTGFTNFELTVGGKWLELLKEIAPQVQRVSMLLNPATYPGGPGGVHVRYINEAAPNFQMVTRETYFSVSSNIEAIYASAAHSSDAVVVMPDTSTSSNSKLIVELASRYRVPTVYPYKFFTDSGGLVSYGTDLGDLYRRSAAYVHRILKGEKPADLPVQAPTKYELVINLKTAKALGLTVPPTLLARADEVIE